jgi:hypothetical protein
MEIQKPQMENRHPVHPALPISKEDLPLRHQNQPPNGSRPFRRRYVTRLP